MPRPRGKQMPASHATPKISISLLEPCINMSIGIIPSQATIKSSGAIEKYKNSKMGRGKPQLNKQGAAT